MKPIVAVKMKSMVVVKKEEIIKSIVIEVPEDVENITEYCYEEANRQSESDDWEIEEWHMHYHSVEEYDE
jgi:hypothetical protein